MKLFQIIAATIVIFLSGAITGGIIVKRNQTAIQPAPVSHRIENPRPEASEVRRVSLSENVPNQGPRFNQIKNVTVPSRMAENLARGRVMFMERATQQLDLSEEQRTKIAGLLKDSHKRMRSISEGIAPDVKNEVRETTQAFLGILSEQQRRRFLTMARSRIGGPGPGVPPNRMQGPPKFKQFENQSPIN